MIPFSDIIYFVLSVFILIIIPGPTMFYLVTRSLMQGKKAGIISLIGVNCADIFYISLVILGVSAVLFTMPFLLIGVKILGACYLLFLAWHNLKARNDDTASSRVSLSNDSPARLFAIGFLTNILNPKVVFFFASIFSQFVNPEYGEVWKQSALLGLIFIIISFLTNSVFIVTASRFSGRMKNRNWSKYQGIVLAVVLTVIAIKVFVTDIK